MKTERKFDVSCDRDHAVEVIGDEETLLSLFPDSQTEVVERSGDRVTVKTHYSALGQEGTATFHFDYRMDGSVRFEKVCDGNVWKALHGQLDFEDSTDGCVATLEMEGSTQRLVPEFTIRGPMTEQVEQMAAALRKKLEE